MEIDIREVNVEDVIKIRVADPNTSYTNADMVMIGDAPQKCCIQDSEGGYNLGIFSREHALNLIAGIQKAIDLGWFD